jgi:uncharacterized protein (DUF427 family)
MTLLAVVDRRAGGLSKGRTLIGGERSVNAVWSYEAPYAAASAIREYLAFYPDRVDAIEIDSKG